MGPVKVRGTIYMCDEADQIRSDHIRAEQYLRPICCHTLPRIRLLPLHCIRPLLVWQNRPQAAVRYAVKIGPPLSLACTRSTPLWPRQQLEREHCTLRHAGRFGRAEGSVHPVSAWSTQNIYTKHLYLFIPKL